MTHSTYSWLPDHHLGVAATLAHADDTIGQVSDLLFDYQTKSDGPFGLRQEHRDGLVRSVVDRVDPVPRKVPRLVADALGSLRAAIEHTVFAEVEFLEGQLNDKSAKSVEMPASTTRENFQEWLKKLRKNGPASLQSGSELARRIESLQPFHIRRNPGRHPLARLTEYTNHAKHRTPVVASVRIAAMYREDNLPPSVRDLPKFPEEPMRVGDVIAETPAGTVVPMNVFPTIGIHRPSTTLWPILMQELDEISRWVRTQAVPRLITGGEPPEPMLPASYEIAVGTDDERRAIADGVCMSAAERHARRLMAASGRKDLAEDISLFPDSPSSDRVNTWLAQLSDEAIIERVNRLSPSRNYDPDTLQHNHEVYSALRDEAVEFDGSSQMRV